MLKTRQQQQQQRKLDRCTAANASTSWHLQRSSGRLRCAGSRLGCSAPRSWSRGLAQAPASKVFSDDEECQGSDAEDNSSSNEDRSSDEE